MEEQDEKSSLEEVVDGAIEAKVKEVKEFIRGLPEESKGYATHRIVFEAVLWGTGNLIEALGILEETKLAYREEHTREVARELEDAEGS